jgi:hypothetical protein
MVGRDAAEQVASPYATGGGGTVLEHDFGAVLLGLSSSAIPYRHWVMT